MSSGASMVAFRTFAAALPFSILACAADPASPASGEGASPYVLSRVGPADLTLHPDEERTLHVLLARDEDGPVGGARIHFELRGGDPSGSRIDAPDAATDEDGVARVRLIAGSRPGAAPFELAATAPDVGAPAAVFTITVASQRAVLRIVPSASTRVADDGVRATTTLVASGSVALRVRELDADTGEPIARDPIAFTLPAAAASRWSTTSGRVAEARTGAAGEARVHLIAAQSAEGPFDVVAQASSGEVVTFSVRVQAAGGGDCVANAQCPLGQICSGDPPTCHDEQPGPDGACDPAGPACGGGQCCDELARVCRDPCPMTCGEGTHCEAGGACGEGACVPDEHIPDLSGLWVTRHDFDLRETLPIGIREVFRGIRLMDQTLLGALTIPWLPGWVQAIVNAFVSRLLQQYLPAWTQEVIHLSDDLFTLLSHLRAEGTLRLARDSGVARLRGTEIWTSLVFYWLPLCGADIAGDPDQPPDCARIDVLTTDSGRADETAQCKGEVLPSIRALATPFTAAVVRRGTGHAVDVDQRQVNLRMGKVLLILVDQLLTSITSGEYHCIQEATDCPPGGGCMVDCDGLGRDIEQSTDGVVDSGTVQQLCAGGVQAVGQIVVEALATAWPLTADTLDFSGSAAISGQADDSACHRGSEPGACAARLEGGTWTGDFFFRLLRAQPGTWEAARPE